MTTFEGEVVAVDAPGESTYSITRWSAFKHVGELEEVGGGSPAPQVPMTGQIWPRAKTVADSGSDMKKFTATIGDGEATSFTLDHNLGTMDAHVQVYATAEPHDTVLADIERTSENQVTVHTAAPPVQDAYRVVIIA